MSTRLAVVLSLGFCLFAGSVFAAPPDAKGKGKGSEERHAKMLKHFDKDGDGKLSDDEKAAAKKAMEERFGENGKGKGGNRDELMKRFDKNGDGTLSDDERAAAKAAIQKRRDAKK